MGRRLDALLEVALVFILILLLPMLYYPFLEQLHIWPISQMIHDLILSAIILIVLIVTMKDFSRFGISLRNIGVDLKVVAIWAIPLVAINTLSNIDISSLFNVAGLGTILLLAIAEALILFVTAKIPANAPLKEDKIEVCRLAIIPASAIGALMIIPAVFLPGIVVLKPIFADHFVLAFLFIGPAEELVFRGYFQSRLNEAFGRPYRFFGVSFGAGIIIASLLFGLVHVLNATFFNPFIGKYGYDLLWGILAFFMGLIFGFIREKTDSIVAPAILHGALDFFNVFL